MKEQIGFRLLITPLKRDANRNAKDEFWTAVRASRREADSVESDDALEARLKHSFGGALRERVRTFLYENYEWMYHRPLWKRIPVSSQMRAPLFTFSVQRLTYHSLEVFVGVAGLNALLSSFGGDHELLTTVLKEVCADAFDDSLGEGSSDAFDFELFPSAALLGATQRGTAAHDALPSGGARVAKVLLNSALVVPVVLLLWVTRTIYEDVAAERSEIRTQIDRLLTHEDELLKRYSEREATVAKLLEARQTQAAAAPPAGKPSVTP